MSRYDYNVGYLPGATAPTSRIKQFLKWSFIALLAYIALQLYQASNLNTKAIKSVIPVSAVDGVMNGIEKSRVDVDDNLQIANITNVSDISIDSDNAVVLSQENNSTEVSSSNDNKIEPLNTQEINDEFDEELAQLLNQMFDK